MPSALSSGFLMSISVNTDSHIFKSANAHAQKHTVYPSLFTSNRLALPGPNPGARPGVGG